MTEINQSETLVKLVEKCVQMCSLLEVARCEIRSANKKLDAQEQLGEAYQKFQNRFVRLLCALNDPYYSFLKNDSRLKNPQTAFYVVEEALLHAFNTHSRKQYLESKQP